MEIRVPVSVGELLDKISILEIKTQRIEDPRKVENVRRELGLLQDAWSQAVPDEDAEVHRLREELRGVNEALWVIEDAIREKEAEAQFDDEFIDLARRVYLTNDRRAALKRELNRRLGSRLIEEKSYAGSGESTGSPDGPLG